MSILRMIPSFTRSVAACMTAATIAGATLIPATSVAQSTSLVIGSAAEAMPAGPFGTLPDGASIAMGQVFVRPGDAACALTCYLQDFSFWLSPSLDFPSAPEDLRFRGFIAEWDGTRATNVLFTSEERSGPTLASQQFTFATSNLSVAAGVQYVAFLSIAGLGGLPATAVADLDIVLADPSFYPDGGWVFTNEGSSVGDLTSNEWSWTGDPSIQARFEANFTTNVVPEPSSLVLLAVGGGLLVCVAKRRGATRA